jgi:hypothetical protein
MVEPDLETAPFDQGVRTVEQMLIEEARQRQRRRHVRVGWALLAIFVVMSLVIVGIGRWGTAPRGGDGPTLPSSRTATLALQP